MKKNDSNTSPRLTDKILKRIQNLHDDYYSPQSTSKDKESLVDRFWIKYKDHHDHHSAWEEFYHSLEPHEKNSLWEEYHEVVKNGEQSKRNFDISNQPTYAEFKEDLEVRTESYTPAPSKRDELIAKAKFHLKPLMTAVFAMAFVLAISMNHIVTAKIKQYVSPGDTLSSPVIVDPNANIDVSDEPRLIIPKINVDVPVVYDVETYKEADIQAGLERGVVHYGQTALPGQIGNNVIVGHSSNNFFNSGKYKFAFVLLSRLEAGDLFMLHYKGERYVYKVFNKKIIEANDFSLIQPTDKPVTTLITCDPPGTSWKRLVVQAEQISPEVNAKTPVASQVITPPDEEVIPGTAPSVWDRIWSIFDR